MPDTFNPFQDVINFHQRYDLEYRGRPRSLPRDMAELRMRLLEEEAVEYLVAEKRAYDITTAAPKGRDQADYTHQLEEALDGLVDLVYVALGTAHLHGFDFEEAWRRVHKANMKKVRATCAADSKRGSSQDVVKPKGWQAPSHTDLVEVNDGHKPHEDRA